MHKRIFRSTVAVALLVLLASIALILGILFDHFEQQIQNELQSEATYIAQGLKTAGTPFFTGLESDKRITLVAPDGTVRIDTAADETTLENHADREEIREALETGTGMSLRYSDTLTEKTVYYATLLSDGNVLRLSTTQYTVFAILLGLIQPLIIVLFIAILLSFILSARTAKSILKPINELNLDDPVNNDTYAELSPLLSKISAQRRTIDQQLKEAVQKESEFRLIVENMSEGFLVVDKNKDILTYNPAALRLLGIDSVTGGSVLLLNRTRNFRSVVEKALAGERAESDMQLSDRIYELIANPVWDEKTIIGAVIIIPDVTERVQREQLRREFTSNISHELKTPLTSISGFAEILRQGDTPPETTSDFAGSIYEEAQRLISLVSDIIKISELDEKSVPYEWEPVDLHALATDMIKRLQPNAEKAGVQMHLLGGARPIVGVRKILDEMLLNLCDNAIKYNKENGVVDIILQETADKVTLTVRDTGIGIPPEDQSRVFERFYRVDKSHSKEIGGTGLGLSIVKHAAQYHNAEISLESTQGKGTSITVRFDAPQIS